jgi:hypothetical protein
MASGPVFTAVSEVAVVPPQQLVPAATASVLACGSQQAFASAAACAVPQHGSVFGASVTTILQVFGLSSFGQTRRV